MDSDDEDGGGGGMVGGADGGEGDEGGATAAWQLPKATALDVRRHDERTLYGAIPGAVHVPADELASALALEPREFVRRYRCERPPRDEPLVVHSRTAGRAFWAAQVAHDAGYGRLLVLRGGAYSWRADGVKPYASYQPWEPPPEPEAAPAEPHDAAAALEELLTLGLATRAGGGGGGGSAAA
ncbi:hypothetical protein MNEG_12642 [Monoraphidium neglectum]|uniref:Rhodanese domain-containing protein n=1 Tax=Monoraphidium neglectum TaxID=145388 RepID=A0A0D2J602_9CHLO|nr:hypothetical protein MNEG_12642 [Monoraphidium neglectum]KIY95322.1 hypothetical protein MNEG_12642 [Monoraphidium neglectum]|eukprot:XP_013894342.1 hypothetical protein MNEG_12642 [Monoraphidium neglectum]